MIVLDTNASRPLYVQLYEQLKEKIFGQELREQDKLPGIRTMADDLCVSRNTVKNAYYQLEAEGFVEAQQGVGFIVQRGIAPLQQPATPTITPNLSQKEFQRPAKKVLYDFQYGGLPYEYFPRQKWLSYFRKVTDTALAKGTDDYPHFQGTPALRKELADYLKVQRGVLCSPEQVVLGSGIHHMLECLCRIAPTHTLYYEEPGYDGSRQVFKNHNFHILPLPATVKGLDFTPLRAAKEALIYVTPSHQFPYGSVLPVGQRTELLRMANQGDCYIIEDDYDSEYRYNSLPIPSLYSMDDIQRVIYMGTFSKSLLPSLRISYMVLPPAVLQRYQGYYSGYQCTVSGTDQGILTYLLQEGAYEKHQRRMSNLYRQKHNLLVRLIETNFPHIKIHGKYAGLHLILEFPKGTSVEEIIQKARKKGVALYSMLPYWADKTKVPSNILFLGYSPLSLSSIEQAMELLKDVW